MIYRYRALHYAGTRLQRPLGISETTFAKWIELKRMPPGRKIDGIVLWDTQEIRDSWHKLKEGDDEANPFDGVTA